MVYEYSINDRLVKTGDVISTKDGTNSIYSLGYQTLGALIPAKWIIRFFMWDREVCV